MTNRKFYNPEKEQSELYTEKWITEKSRVKDINDLSVKHHYWEDSDGELWLDFNDPMENVRADFDAYRQRLNYMSPQELKSLRKSLHLSQRAFASELGISYSVLSQIESNKRVQVKYQNNLFEWAKLKYELNGQL